MTRDDSDDDMLGWDSGYSLGVKIVEMCDRVKVAHSYMPGAVAKTAIDVDGVRFEVEVRVAASAASIVSEAD